MTIKEVAQLTGLSHQAIYKRLKAHGVKLETLKDKATGQLTSEGEAAILVLFNISDNGPTADEKPEEKTQPDPQKNEVAELRNQVEKLQSEVAQLRNQVASLESERDYLRLSLEREQQLHGLTISKLPTPPPALPPAPQERGKIRAWWHRIRGKD